MEKPHDAISFFREIRARRAHPIEVEHRMRRAMPFPRSGERRAIAIAGEGMKPLLRLFRTFWLCFNRTATVSWGPLS